MTPAERTYDAMRKILTAKDRNENPGAVITGVILEVIEAAEADMRERCAQIVDGWHIKKGGYTELAHQIRTLP